MPVYVVTFEHPDEAGWKRHLQAHVEYLQKLLKEGTLHASGPFAGNPDRKAMLILKARDRAHLDKLIAEDPFAIENLIENMTIAEWDPIFGALNAESSYPGQLQGD